MAVDKSLLLQSRSPLPSKSRVPEVLVLCGTWGTVEMLNLKRLVQFYEESYLISRIQARELIQIQGLFMEENLLIKHHFSAYLLMGDTSQSFLGTQTKKCWKF